MSLKDNFNQAVKELLKRDGLVGSDPSRNAGSELDYDAGAPQSDESSAVSAAKEPSYQTPPPQAASKPTATAEPYYETEETTIISRNTIIDGNIRSFANINIEGSVKGDVQITKNANLSGKIVGNLDCNNVSMLGSSMQGNVASKGQVKMDRDSLILGDISAQYLDLDGKIKGNVEIGGKAEFKSDAIVFGNINASTITVLDGATIQGYVNTTFLQENAGSVFPDGIAVSE